jgi:hypothetical protein
MVPPEDMQKVEERLDMWENLLEQDPYIKKKTAQAQAKGREEGREEGRIEASRDSVVNVIRVRFPRLAKAARQRVQNIEKLDDLTELHNQLLSAPDETIARKLLNPPSA